jgi:hypothetical protein
MRSKSPCFGIRGLTYKGVLDGKWMKDFTIPKSELQKIPDHFREKHFWYHNLSCMWMDV